MANENTPNNTDDDFEDGIDKEEAGGKAPKAEGREERPARGERRRGADDEGEEEDEGRRGRRRSGKGERSTERLYGKMHGVEKVLADIAPSLKTLGERLERLEQGQQTIVQRADPKPKFSDFEGREDEYEGELDAWHERNPKGAKKPEGGEGGERGGRGKEGERGGKRGNEREEPQALSSEQMAQVIGVDLETLEDFQDDIADLREEHDDYDEVLGRVADHNSIPMTRAAAELEEGAKALYWLAKNDRKEYKRIAALKRTVDASKALEAVIKDMGDGADSEDEPRSETRTKKNDREPFSPLKPGRVPRGKAKDESTMTDDEFFAEEEKNRRANHFGR
jgi:hypothetical protein